ncbi:MAG: discoidin domain-containing protein, partial [Phycisphaeraceae bacterium]|nr:discoidin domain-containing protein [Phycisphaeraceae bacterium]
MWNERFRWIGVIVLGVVLLSNAVNANLIVNGSFENPATDPGQSRDNELGTLWFSGGTGWGDEDVDGWTRTTRIWHVTDGGAGLMPDGNYAEVLDASYEHNGIDVLSQGGLKLTAGMPYELSFYTWGENGNPRIDVDLSGADDIMLLDDYETDESDDLAELVSVRFVPTITGEYTIEFRGDRYEGANVHSHAWIDDVRLVIKLPVASTPSPGNEDDDVPHNVILGWRPGSPSIVKHDVYFGTTFEDVNNASALVSLGQDVNTFDVGALGFGQTYYWRVDEVNSAPDNTLFKGEIWSFTTEPYSIQIPGSSIAVTASSSSNEFSQPEKTFDGSGLGADGSHGITPETMWFTAAVDLDPWIQYKFQTVRKLDTVKIWNSNSSAEIAIGWGIKDVQIEYSVDGENWDVLEGAAQLTRAPGLPTYSQYDTIDFGGVAARQVRLNIQSNWGGILMSYGLSEVQFYMIPAEARSPVPASGSVDVLPSTVAQWRAGREAAQHTIYVGTDVDTVADGSSPSVITNTNSLDLASLDLELGATYT